MSRRLRVGVIFGGRSVEHEISLISARSVMAAIDADRFEIVPIGITKEGRWLVSGDPLALLAAGDGARGAITSAVPAGLPGFPARGTGAEVGAASAARAEGSGPLDVVFPLVHGIFGEDGTMQGLLEMADMPYVGAGVLGSAAGMDKDIAKRIFLQAGLPVAACLVVRDAEWEAPGRRASLLDRALTEIGLPCFVKPSGSGSSVGVSKVRAAGELAGAVELAFGYDRKVLIERAVDAREIEVAVLGNDEPEASVPGEIVPCHEFYDYAAKYLEDSTLLVPAPVTAPQAAEARRLAVEAFRALDLSGLARVDLFLDRGNGRFWLNEVNTLPGFTPISMYPRLWEASGLPYRALISRLIDLALERHARRRALRTTYDPGRG